MKILLVEDEPKVAAFIKEGLEDNGFLVDVAINGRIAREMGLEREYDLFILDVIVPYINGVELCKIFKHKKTEIPVIMLTALGAIDDKLEGFNAGADDYLVKPFEFKELVARINAILNRSKIQANLPKTLQIADLVLNLDDRVAYRNNTKIELTTREFSLLKYLVVNKGQVLSRAEIAENVWDINFDTGTNIIDVYITYLRKKIDKDSDQKLIHTKFGKGFMIKENDLD